MSTWEVMDGKRWSDPLFAAALWTAAPSYCRTATQTLYQSNTLVALSQTSCVSSHSRLKCPVGLKWGRNGGQRSSPPTGASNQFPLILPLKFMPRQSTNTGQERGSCGGNDLLRPRWLTWSFGFALIKPHNTNTHTHKHCQTTTRCLLSFHALCPSLVIIHVYISCL